MGGVTLDIAAGSFVALVGFSGSGKSTLLKMVNTLVTPSGGRVLFGGEDVTSLNQAQLRRRVGYVFQGIGLFPHMSVGENIAIGPRLTGEKLSPARIAELLTLVELDPDMASRLPGRLVGRSAPTGGGCKSAGRRSAAPHHGRTFRRARSDHP